MRKRYNYDKEKGYAEFKIYENGEVYNGIARLHPDDIDFGTEYTGLTIAETRAKINRSSRKAKKVEKEIRKLLARVGELDNQLFLHQQQTEALKVGLEHFIEAKESLMQKIRKNRQKDKAYQQKISANTEQKDS